MPAKVTVSDAVETVEVEEIEDRQPNLIEAIEAYLIKYVAFSDPCYGLPLALWTVGTFLFPDFDAFPYLVITSETKRAGKTRLAELLSFACSNPRQFGAMTPATLFISIETESPTIFFDEAEVLSSEAASAMRAVLNMGYRKGQKVPRAAGKTAVREFNTYCPKVFILIGDVFDTLKDRSIIIRMRRAEPLHRFTYDAVKAEGANLREQLAAMVETRKGAILESYLSHRGVSFLTDRDEEIWTPLFTLASILCPDRLDELSRAAVDMSTEKTMDVRRYVNLLGEEQKAQDDEYSKRLLFDLHAVLGEHKALGTIHIIEHLKALPTAPWRKYRGIGLTVHNLADMLSRFGVNPQLIRVGKGRKDSKVMRGYRLAAVEKAIKHMGDKK